MKRYFIISGFMVVFFLVVLLVVTSLGIGLLNDPTWWMGQGGMLAAILGVGLLVADVVLPVPSSLVMVAHGALFGVLRGTALSLLGSVLASMVSFAIGRHGERLLRRVTTPEERARADSLLQRWGAVAICVSRPVPILAETVAIMAGTSSLGWGRVVVASLVGSLPPALVYALAGAAVADFRSTVLMFSAVIFVTGLFWLSSRLIQFQLAKGHVQQRQTTGNVQV